MADLIAEQAALVAQIRPILAGHDPGVQGAVLGELVALYLVGHRPDIRDEMLTLHAELVRALIPIAEREVFAERERPASWPPAK